jgi:hypothetical protein
VPAPPVLVVPPVLLVPPVLVAPPALVAPAVLLVPPCAAPPSFEELPEQPSIASPAARANDCREIMRMAASEDAHSTVFGTVLERRASFSQPHTETQKVRDSNVVRLISDAQVGTIF